MRCLVLSLLLLGLVSHVSSQIVFQSKPSGSSGYLFVNQTIESPDTLNPTFNLTTGITYIFNLNAVSTHPFMFSTARNDLSTNISPVDPTLLTVVGNNCNSANIVCTNGASCTGYFGASCSINVTFNAAAANQVFYYKCTTHSPMIGQINVAAGPTSPATPTPTAGATPTPTPTGTPSPTGTPTSSPLVTGGTLTGNAFTITGNNQTLAYIFTAGGIQYANPTLEVTAGSTVTVTLSLPNSFLHPIAFTNNNDLVNFNPTTDIPAGLNNGSYTLSSGCDTGYSTAYQSVRSGAPTSNPCVITVSVPAANAGQVLYYRCVRHLPMIGTIKVVAKNSAFMVSPFTAIVTVVLAVIAFMQ